MPQAGRAQWTFRVRSPALDHMIGPIRDRTRRLASPRPRPPLGRAGAGPGAGGQVLLSQVLLKAPPLIALVESSCRPLLSTMMISVGLWLASAVPFAVAPA